MSVGPLGWMGAAGEAAAGISGDQRHGLPGRGQPAGSAERQRDIIVVNDGGPNLGFIGNPEELVGGELAAVGGFGQASLGEQILQADSDDHRCRYPTHRGLIGSFEQAGACLLQRIMQSLHLGPLVGNVDDGAVFIFDRAAAGFGQRVQDGVELGTDGVGESAGEMPHAVAALFEFEVAAVLLQLIIDRLRPVGVGGVDHGVGEAAQLRRRQDDGVVGEQLLGLINVVGLHVGAGQFVHGPLHNGHLLRGDESVALQGGQSRQHRVQA